VLTGAYSVLEDAPAIVTAVDRYVTVDSQRSGSYFPDEVRAAAFDAPYWFDASRLRRDDCKLGLGSSAAILLAMLAARELVQRPTDNAIELRERIFLPALRAHRLAQAGGSGIDVAASCFGGTLKFERGREVPGFKPISLPRGIAIEIWSSTVEASTRGLLAKVQELKKRNRKVYDTHLGAQASASCAAIAACVSGDPSSFVAAIQAQRVALTHLGLAAGADIVTKEVQALAKVAERHGGAVIPAGAGGGDIALYVGNQPSFGLDGALVEQRHVRLDLCLGAEGVHRIPDEC